MNHKTVFHVVSYILFFIGVAQAISFLVGWIMGDTAAQVGGLAGATVISLLTAGIMWFVTRGGDQLRRRDGYAVVVFAWICACILGTWPYVLTGAITNLPSAFFESCSGLTTTGASVMSELETHSRGVLFWRSMSQWLGGMGVIVLLVALMPFIGIGALSIFQAEMPGPKADPLAPKIAKTSKLLWGIYLGLTVACALCLMACGMSLFEAICHAFSTISTGGFSPHSGSVGGYDSIAIELVVILFMILGGTNFALHFRFLIGKFDSHIRDQEFKFFIALLGFFVLTVALSLWWQIDHFDSFGSALRASAFEVTSMLTNTGFGGYGTGHFTEWSVYAIAVVVVCSFFGGCAGSTSGAIKLIRVMIASQVALREIKQTLLPKAVVSIRIGEQILKDDVVKRSSAFLIAFLLVGVISSLIISPFVPDGTTTASSVYACLTNIGPGLGEHIGPAGNYAVIEGPGKIYLCFLMILGRLELFTFLAIFSPYFWRR